MIDKDTIKAQFKEILQTEEDRDFLKDMDPLQKRSDSTDQELVFKISFEDLDLLLDDLELSRWILDNPEEGFKAIEEALEVVDIPGYLGYEEEENYDIQVCIKGLDDSDIRKVREIRGEDIGRYIGVEGVVRHSSETYPIGQNLVYECERCGAEYTKTQDELSNKRKEPLECKSCGKSNNKTNFKVEPKKSSWEDRQDIKIFERQRNLDMGENPREQLAVLKNRLVDQVKSSDEVILYGIYKPRFENKRSKKPKTYLDVKAVKIKDRVYSDINLDPEEEERVEELAEDPEIFDKIVRSIAPSIKNRRKIKESIALQIFGGVRKETETENTRGDIHILLAGDPEVGKSKILDYVSKIALKGIKASGRGTSGVGLTASVTQEEMAGETKYVLDPGVLPMAEGGLACIDEFDKMKDKDRKSIHRALSDQEFSINKANIHRTLSSKCSVLSVANPKMGRFETNTNEDLIDQIDLKPTLLSRFDYIWIIKGDKKEEEEKELAKSLLEYHQTTGKMAKGEELKNNKYTPLISQEELKNYIKKAKEIKPVLSEEAKEYIRTSYLDLTKEIESIGPRTLEGLIRSAEASARLEHREEVKVKDAKRSVEIKAEQLDRADQLEKLLTGYTEEERHTTLQILEIARDLEDQGTYGEEGIPEDHIITEAQDRGLTEERAKKGLVKAKKKGSLAIPLNGRVKNA